MGLKYVMIHISAPESFLIPLSSLAWCELYLVFANILRRLDMKLLINDETYVLYVNVVVIDSIDLML